MTASPSIDQIFAEAAGCAPGPARESILSVACGGDAELRQRVERLLQAHGDAGSFLESPAGEAAPTTYRQEAARPGARIGPYKLLQPIGEGGMGVVYMAEQKTPVERRVALKIIKPGMDSQ